MCHRQGITRKSATLLIAAVQFLHGMGMFISASVSTNHTSRIAFFAIICVSALNMWLALVLCVGVNTNRVNLILLWLGWATLILICFVVSVPLIALFSYTITEHFRGPNFAASFIMYSLSFFLHCMFIHVVYGYYEELCLSQMNHFKPDGDNIEADPQISVINNSNYRSNCVIKNEITY